MQHAAAAASLDQYCQFTASYCMNNSHLYSLKTQPESECNSLPTQGTPTLTAGKVEWKEQLNMANAIKVMKSIKQEPSTFPTIKFSKYYPRHFDPS